MDELEFERNNKKRCRIRNSVCTHQIDTICENRASERTSGREHFNICHLEMGMTFCYRQTLHSIYNIHSNMHRLSQTVEAIDSLYTYTLRSNIVLRKFGTFLMCTSAYGRTRARTRLACLLARPFTHCFMQHSKFKTRSTKSHKL